MERILPKNVIKDGCEDFAARVFGAEPHPKVFFKAAQSMLCAIVAKGSPLLHTMAKYLCGANRDKSKDVQEQLSYWLARYDFFRPLRHYMLDHLLPSVSSEAILAVDSSDISKEFGGEGMEGMAMGYDGSRDVTAMGHDIVSVAAVDGRRGIPVSVELVKGRKGKVNKTKAVCWVIAKKLKRKLRFVFDRGYDSEEFINWLLDMSMLAVVRINKMERDVFGNGEGIGKTMSKETSFSARLKSPSRTVKAKIKWRIGSWPRGKGKEATYRQLLVVSSTFNGKSLYFYYLHDSNLEDMSRDELKTLALKAAHAYFNRWCIEVFFQNVKQMFGLEDARVRKFKRLRNLVAMCVAAYEYVRQELMGSGRVAQAIRKSMQDNFGEVVAKYRAFIANLRELLQIATPRSITGRPRRKPDDNVAWLPTFEPLLAKG